MSFDEEPEDEVEDVDALVAAWQEETARLRVVADRVRWLAVGLKESLRFDGPDNLRPSVEEFERTVQEAEQAAFKGLIIDTMTLHRRGLGVLDPDRAPKPVSSPFVRRMPEDQSEIEAKRFETQGRHMEAYELHILQAFEHFVQAWTALIDGSLICDWEMIDDEFPKLATLAAEVNRAYVIWSSKNR